MDQGLHRNLISKNEEIGKLLHHMITKQLAIGNKQELLTLPISYCILPIYSTFVIQTRKYAVFCSVYHLRLIHNPKPKV
jgi:hypothetical protein